MTLINTKLVSHPMNWIVILLMLIFAGIAGHLLLSMVGIEPATGNTGYALPAGQQPQK